MFSSVGRPKADEEDDGEDDDDDEEVGDDVAATDWDCEHSCTWTRMTVVAGWPAIIIIGPVFGG